MFTHIKKQGFSLIELLVVVSIISVLTTVSLGLYLDSWKQTRDAVRLQDMRLINQALIAFYIDNRRFPGLPIAPSASPATDGIVATGQLIGVGNPIDAALQPYMSEVPQDPSHDAGTGANPTTGANFFYSYDPDHIINPDCTGATPNLDPGPVFAFHRFESGQPRDIDTCLGGDMLQGDADYNRVLR